MRPEYDGIKFYSKEDMSIGWELNRAESILDNFDTSSNYTDVNKVIELYNIQQLINIGIPLTTWTAETYEKYGQMVKRFSQIIGRYFSTINDSNFIDIQKHVSINYLDDFWVLFVKYKVYKRISPETCCSYLKMPETTLYVLLHHRIYYIQ